MNHILLIEIPYEGQTFTEDYLNKEIIEKVFGEEK